MRKLITHEDIYDSVDEFDKALEDLYRAIELNELYADAYYNPASVNELTGEIDKALSNLEMYISLKEESSTSEKEEWLEELKSR
jgi:tetratricopeptide (TPR) repeat protein